MLHRDPLFHFLIAGCVLFAVLSGFDKSQPQDRIVISAGELAELAGTAELLQGRAPTPQEMDQLVAAAVRDEVYYREARARGLDEDDIVVRQRLVEKMRELTENLAEPVPPQTDLEAWFEANRLQFRTPEQITFEQIFLSPSERGDALADDAADILAALRDGANPTASGDRTPLSPRYEQADVARIRTLFGESFAATVFSADEGGWFGPIESGFGSHLVRVLARTPPRDPAYTEVADAVRAAFSAQRLAAANEAAFDALSRSYDVAVEWEPGAEPQPWP